MKTKKGKRRRTMQYSKENSKINSSQKEIEDYVNEREEGSSNIDFRQKRNTINYSENRSQSSDHIANTNYLTNKNSNESSYEDLNEDIINLQRVREVSMHRSGRGITLVNGNNNENLIDNTKENRNSIININSSILQSQNPINRIQKLNYNDIDKNNKNKENNSGDENLITIKKRFVKNIEFEKFSQKIYVISNFKSKSNGKKNEKEMRKYIITKPIYFTLKAIYDYNNVENENSAKHKFSISLKKYNNKDDDDNNCENYEIINILQKYKKNDEENNNTKIYKYEGLSIQNNNNEIIDYYKNMKDRGHSNYKNEDNKESNESSKYLKPVNLIKTYKNIEMNTKNNYYNNKINKNENDSYEKTILSKGDKYITKYNVIDKYNNDDNSKNSPNNDKNEIILKDNCDNAKNIVNSKSMQKYNNNKLEIDYTDHIHFKNSITLKDYKNIIDNEENIKSYKRNYTSLKKYHKNFNEENIKCFNNNETSKIFNKNNKNIENSKNYEHVNSFFSYINKSNDTDEHISSKKCYSNNKNIMDDDYKERLNAMSRKDYTISHFEKKLSKIERMKENLLNENTTINKEINERIKKYRNIFVTNNNEITYISNKYNEKVKNDKGRNGGVKTIRKKRMSIFEIAQKRGLGSNTLYNNDNYENMATDSEKTKKVKLNSITIKNENNKNEEEENAKDIKLKKNDDGTKYILFNCSNIHKKKYKMEKLILTPCKNISLFFRKKIINNNNRDKKNSKKEICFKDRNVQNNHKNINSLKMKNKNKTAVGNICTDKEKNKINNNIGNNKLVKDNLDQKDNYKAKFYFEFIQNANQNSDKELIKDNKIIFKDVHSDSDNNTNTIKDDFKRNKKRICTVDEKELLQSKQNLLNNYYEEKIKNLLKRRQPKVYTIKRRGLADFNDFSFFEDNSKGSGKLIFTKAKIKKFKTSKGNSAKYSYTRRKKGNNCQNSSDKKTNSSKNDNSNKKLKNHSYTRRGTHNRILKNSLKKCLNFNISYNSSENEENSNDKYLKNLSSDDHDINISKIKINKKNNNKSQNNESNTRNPQLAMNRKIKDIPLISINKNNKKQMTNLSTNQNKMNKKFTKKSTSLIKKSPNPININYNIEIEKNRNKIKPLEMSGIDAIKSKFKIKLIEINDNLLDAIHYYNGPVDLSCISTKNYKDSVISLKKRMIKCGFKNIDNENNYIKFTNGLDTYLVDIVKIRNNLLYYLFLKNQ